LGSFLGLNYSYLKGPKRKAILRKELFFIPKEGGTLFKGGKDFTLFGTYCGSLGTFKLREGRQKGFNLAH